MYALNPISEAVIKDWPIRQGKKKSAFRKWFVQELKKNHCSVNVETGRFILKNNNIIVGNIEKARYIFTAHYDTPFKMLFPNIVAPLNLGLTMLYSAAVAAAALAIAQATAFVFGMLFASYSWIYWFKGIVFWFVLLGCFFSWPNRHNYNDNTSGLVGVLELLLHPSIKNREDVAFVFFDNEELGLLGSGLFNQMHQSALRETFVINFDCIGEGGHVLLVMNQRMHNYVKTSAELQKLSQSLKKNSNSKFLIYSDKDAFYPSDQFHFTNGIGVAAMQKSRKGVFYIDKIHTSRDLYLNRENIYKIKEFFMYFLNQ